MSFPPNLGIPSSFIIDSSSPLVFQEFPSLLPPLERICSPFSRSKMNGYSRIKKSSTTRSKSVDFADLSFPHHAPRSTANFCSNSKFKSQETKPNISNALKITAMHNLIPEHEHEGGTGEVFEHEEGTGEVFGVILSRKCSISSAPSDQKVMAERESSSFQTVLKRSLSIKRSASVSDGYSRIHHQSELTAEDDDQYGTGFTSQKRYVKKKGKFLGAFRRLFGL